MVWARRQFGEVSKFCNQWRDLINYEVEFFYYSKLQYDQKLQLAFSLCGEEEGEPTHCKVFVGRNRLLFSDTVARPAIQTIVGLGYCSELRNCFNTMKITRQKTQIECFSLFNPCIPIATGLSWCSMIPQLVFAEMSHLLLMKTKYKFSSLNVAPTGQVCLQCPQTAGANRLIYDLLTQARKKKSRATTTNVIPGAGFTLVDPAWSVSVYSWRLRVLANGDETVWGVEVYSFAVKFPFLWSTESSKRRRKWLYPCFFFRTRYEEPQRDA